MRRTNTKKSAPVLSQDPIPEDCISLAEAFWELELAFLNQVDLLHAVGPSWHPRVPNPLHADMRLRYREMSLLLRYALQAGELDALVNNPDTGQKLKLPPVGWIPDDDESLGAIKSDYIIPDDINAVGPVGTEIGGKLRPVILRREEFRDWRNRFEQSRSSANNLNPTDQQLIAEMRKIVEGEQVSVREAARRVASQARGKNTELDSKVDRLRRLYRTQSGRPNKSQ